MKREPSNNNGLNVEVIGYDSGWGCADFGCEDGPHHLPASDIIHNLRDKHIGVRWRGPLGLRNLGCHETLATKDATLPLVTEGLRRLSTATARATVNGDIPIVIGGDHSSAMGTWSGIVSALGAHGHFGLIWIDAHMDAHTHETAHQGKWGGWWHGQPVSALCGHGLPAFTQLGSMRPKINPKNLSIIGPHSFEAGEEDFVRQQGIRVFHLDEVKKRGFKDVFAEALARANDGTTGFGLTIDLDAFRNEDAPGVGTNEEDGLVAADVLPILRSVAHKPMFHGLEIAEFNPHKDRDYKTARLISKLIENIFAP